MLPAALCVSKHRLHNRSVRAFSESSLPGETFTDIVRHPNF
jgi:hypothetical protein